ncbi:hypothetical protein GN109_02235 [Collimonas pratensis]|uniref:hypothetical protein n=1 Tax=Collimonas pratensis TaxID=279113 RepID=UPI00143CF064|nr:hypothetical protein [Collimonas pratensis]NKI68226.1 hypothetical protein [Collimonas pratensis]
MDALRKNAFLFTLLCGVFTTAHAGTLPKNIIGQIPAGYEVLSYKSGELNDDKLEDFLVAVHKADEKTIAEKTGKAPRRPLLLFIQNSDGTYMLAKRNDHVIFAVDEGGQCDPFEDGEEGLAIKNHYFTIQNSVACGSHWTDFITFRYDPKLRDWIFHKRVSETWVMNNSKDPNADALVLGSRRLESGKGKPPVPFEKYSAD